MKDLLVTLREKQWPKKEISFFKKFQQQIQKFLGSSRLFFEIILHKNILEYQNMELAEAQILISPQKDNGFSELLCKKQIHIYIYIYIYMRKRFNFRVI